MFVACIYTYSLYLIIVQMPNLDNSLPSHAYTAISSICAYTHIAFIIFITFHIVKIQCIRQTYHQHAHHSFLMNLTHVIPCSLGDGLAGVRETVQLLILLQSRWQAVASPIEVSLKSHSWGKRLPLCRSLSARQ